MAMRTRATSDQAPPKEAPVEPRFNLLTEPWIPVFLPDSDQPHRELGIREVIAQAPQIRCLADSTPIVNLALLRFLMALLHAAEVTRGDDHATWTKKLDVYLEKWHDRFWLYHPKYPFMQDAGKRGRKADKSIATLVHSLAQDTNIAHFAHCRDDSASMTLPECARGLLLQIVATTNSGRGFKAGPNGAPPVYLVPCLPTLEALLRLHLPKKSRTKGDAPNWEATETASDEIGFLEGLTWQPRAMLLAQPNQDGSVASLVYDQGKDADNVQCATRDAKVKPSRHWSDPHALSLKHPNPLNGNPSLTMPLRILDALTQHTPAAIASAALEHGALECSAMFVANDGKAKYYSVADIRLTIPASFLESATTGWQPIKKQYKHKLGSLFIKIPRLEQIPEPEAQKVVGKIVENVAGFHPLDTEEMDKKARSRYEENRLRQLSEPLERASFPLKPLRTADALRVLLADAPKISTRVEQLGEEEDERSARAGFISTLKDPKTFTPTVLHRLRAAPTESLEQIVPLTDFLNQQLRNKKYLTGRERRWGWLVAHLYAWHPHHTSNRSHTFGICLRRLRRMSEKKHRLRFDREVIDLFTCPLDQIEEHLVRFIRRIRHLQRNRPNQTPPRAFSLNYLGLLDDFCQLESNRRAVVKKWFDQAINSPTSSESDTLSDETTGLETQATA